MPGCPGFEYYKQAEKHEGDQLSLHIQVRDKSETIKNGTRTQSVSDKFQSSFWFLIEIQFSVKSALNLGKRDGPECWQGEEKVSFLNWNWIFSWKMTLML